MKESGFSLMELMIVIAIISILVALALPSYSQYTKRAQYTDIIQASRPYKLAVTLCFHQSHTLDNCQGGQHGIPADTNTPPSKTIATITTQPGGIIAITPSSEKGFTQHDTYILTPSLEHGHLSWQSSGGGVEQGYAK